METLLLLWWLGWLEWWLIWLKRDDRPVADLDADSPLLEPCVDECDKWWLLLDPDDMLDVPVEDLSADSEYRWWFISDTVEVGRDAGFSNRTERVDDGGKDDPARGNEGSDAEAMGKSWYRDDAEKEVEGVDRPGCCGDSTFGGASEEDGVVGPRSLALAPLKFRSSHFTMLYLCRMSISPK